MRHLTKNYDFNNGELVFDVGIDRNITCQTYQEFPNLIAYLMEQEKDIGSEKISEEAFMLKLMKEKKLVQALSVQEDIAKLVEFALPLMLKKVDEKISPFKAEEIIGYVKANEVDEEFNMSIFDFISLGFTQCGQDKKPKVKFVTK